MALHAADLRLAEECLVRAADLSGLLLLYTSTGHAQVRKSATILRQHCGHCLIHAFGLPQGIERLAALAKKKGKLNIAFVCSLLRGQPEACLDLLVSSGRAPEAAFLARTYTPSRMSEMVGLWKEQLRQVRGPPRIPPFVYCSEALAAFDSPPKMPVARACGPPDSAVFRR